MSARESGRGEEATYLFPSVPDPLQFHEMLGQDPEMDPEAEAEADPEADAEAKIEAEPEPEY